MNPGPLRSSWLSWWHTTPCPVARVPRQACVASSWKHKVEHAGERSGFDPVRSRQSNRDRRALPSIVDAGIETVRLVQCLTGDIHLRDELPPAGRTHGKVDVTYVRGKRRVGWFETDTPHRRPMLCDHTPERR